MPPAKKPKDLTRLSPSIINNFYKCKRLFFYTHLLGKTTPPNIHLYKGTFSHKVLENVFINTRYVDIEKYVENQMPTWNPGKLCPNPTESEFHKKEVETMLRIFARRFKEKIDMLIMEGKAKEVNHAWNILKPRLREHKIHDKELNVVGVIDSIEEGFEGQIYLVDYKTSKLYRHTMPDEYFRQLGIYAYLYNQEFGNLPTYVAIHYLRYGEVFIVPVNQSIVDAALKDIHFVKEYMQKTDIKDYPPCKHEWCDCRNFDKQHGIENSI